MKILSIPKTHKRSMSAFPLFSIVVIVLTRCQTSITRTPSLRKQNFRPIHNPKPNMLKVNLADLPHDIIQKIADCLSVADFQNLRLAGMGAADCVLHAKLHSTFSSRIESLHRLMADVSGRSFGYGPFYPCVNMNCRNFELLSDLECPVARAKKASMTMRQYPCKICHLSPVAVSSIGEGVSDADDTRIATIDVRLQATDLLVRIAREMPSIRAMRLYNLTENGSEGPRKLLELSMFNRLHGLELSFFNVLPEGVLMLSGLEVLLLIQMPQLKSLPTDLGNQLPQLRRLVLFHVGFVVIPKSVLDTLERNFRDDADGVVIVSEFLHVSRDRKWVPDLSKTEHPHLFQKHFLKPPRQLGVVESLL